MPEMDVWFNGEEKKGVENMVNGYKGRREKQIEEKVNAAKKCPYCKQFFPSYNHSRCPDCGKKLEKAFKIMW